MLEVRIGQNLGTFTLDTDFTAPTGITVLFGRSGSGKTSVINAISGLSTPDRGSIRLGERTLFDSGTRIALPPHKRRIGYIFQDARLFPHLTVRQNLLFGRWFARLPAGQDLARVADMLGITLLLPRKPAALSGGEKQRVAIGRALLSDPALILADEPLAALDEQRKNEILPYFERLRDETGVPVLYVTHSPAEVARLATTVVVMDAGRVVRQGEAHAILADASLTPLGVRQVGAMVDAVIRHHHPDGLTEVAAGSITMFLPAIQRPIGALVRVRIPASEVMLSRSRPEDISALNILPARIEAIRAGDGPGAIVSLTTPAGAILARVTRRSAQLMSLEVGQDLFAVIKTVGIAPQDIGS